MKYGDVLKDPIDGEVIFVIGYDRDVLLDQETEPVQCLILGEAKLAPARQGEITTRETNRPMVDPWEKLS